MAAATNVAEPPPADSAPGNNAGQAAADIITARFTCIDGSALVVRYDKGADTATVVRGAKQVATLDHQRSGSGIYYRSGEYVLRGKGGEISFSTPDQPPLPCTQTG
ncbi:MliC family protein [Stakelama marina]|uniref:MliC family protein n=1 Tax=Stakelama marina TaxID=2826939 RepID=A0A8T4IF40_9SPHN|nr:MliC family protein [Stakelama marina]MBR0553247.1 MliC family protein [Stakelama marina]